MFVLGLAGSKGAGKDTVAEVLLEEYAFDRKACGDVIRDVLQVMFGFSHHQMLDRALKEATDPKWGFSPRRAAQIIGTQVGHEFGSDIWIKIVVNKIKHLNATNPKCDRFIVTDIRYPAEAEYIMEHLQAETWLVKRPGHEGDDHESERFAREGKFPKTFDNHSTIESLHTKVKLAFEKLAIRTRKK